MREQVTPPSLSCFRRRRPPLLPLPYQASACDRERRCLEESGGAEQQGRALQDAKGADGVHAGVYASSGHYGTDGVSARFACVGVRMALR